MLIKIPIKYVDLALKATSNAYLTKARQDTQYKRFVEVDSDLLDRKTLKALNEVTKETINDNDFAGNIDFAYRASKGKSSAESLLITNMDQVLPALKQFISLDRIKGYVFVRQEYNAVAPFLVTDISMSGGAYRASREYNYPQVHLAWSSLTEKLETTTFSVTPHNLASMFAEHGIEYSESWTGHKDNRRLLDVKAKSGGLTAEQIFKHHDYFKETAELHDLYDKQVERFMKFLPMYGQQFRVRGSATTGRSWWHTTQTMLTEGKPARCIVVTTPAVCRAVDEDGSSGRHKRRKSYGDDEEDSTPLDNELSIPLDEVTLEDMQSQVDCVLTSNKELTPFQPTLVIFHLDLHKEFTIHVNNLGIYKYKDNLQDMLILPQEVKDLTQMLVAASSEDVEDVIEGKSQSTVLACVGDPGLGKTLMAEVMAEACRKPLYKIQAAQLGGGAEELERNLVTILRRAERWNCLVMIDEANAYIHSRGHDIEQNAVVGVFLRKLEYFKGILILTTNKTKRAGEDGVQDLDFDIDDAILSRCTAVFHFELPSKQEARKHWELQGKLLGVKLKDTLILELVKEFHISGRTIRHLLKLTARWAALKKEDLTLDHFKTCANYVPLTQSEKVKGNNK